MYKILYLTIPLLVLLSSCSQTKQNRSISPYFDGILKANGTPISKVKVMLSVAPGDKQCQKAKVFTTTNQQGKFSLKAASEKHTYTPFVNYELDEWNVCALYNESIYTLHSDNRYAAGNVSDSIFLDCDLATLNAPCNAQH